MKACYETQYRSADEMKTFTMCTAEDSMMQNVVDHKYHSELAAGWILWVSLVVATVYVVNKLPMPRGDDED